MSAAAGLRVEGLTKSFAGLRAVDNVSFTVEPGTVTALIGPNGAGKTTVFNLVTNVYRPDAGEALLDGRSLRGRPLAEIAAAGLVRTFQSARVFPTMTVLENVMAGAHLRHGASVVSQMLRLPAARDADAAVRRSAESVIDLIGLGHCRDMPAHALPMGAQKLLDIGRALMSSPTILLLDEPAAGLNDAETEEVATLIAAARDAGVTIGIVEHNMALIMGIADWIVVLDAGSVIAQGTPSEIRANERVIEAYLGPSLEPATC